MRLFGIFIPKSRMGKGISDPGLMKFRQPRAVPMATASASESASVAESDRKAPKSTSGTVSTTEERRAMGLVR